MRDHSCRERTEAALDFWVNVGVGVWLNVVQNKAIFV